MRRAYRFAASAGMTRVGGPLGAIASRRDGREAESFRMTTMRNSSPAGYRLAEAAKAEGLVELYVEPTPMRREWPWTIAQALDDGQGGEECGGSMEVLRRLGPRRVRAALWPLSRQYGRLVRGAGAKIGVIHIQQTDFQFDRHWDFTELGCVDPKPPPRCSEPTGSKTCQSFWRPFIRSSATTLRSSTR